MIWTLKVDDAFIAAFEDAGVPDQRAIDAFLAKTKRRQHAMKHTGIRRYYYLCKGNPRIFLCCVGRPLQEWRGSGAKLLIGTREIIGEFDGNRDYIGQRGFQMKAEPIEWLSGRVDQEFDSGEALLSEISEQIIDRPAIEESQERIARRYQHKDQRRRR